MHNSSRKRRPFSTLFSFVCVGVLVAVAYVAGKNLVTTSADGKSPPVVVVKPAYAHKETVCVDPGHGGDDPGAVNNNINERDINLIVANQVKTLLNQAGYEVFMTRTTNDDTFSNNDRYTFCNTKNATIMVSIHHNFFNDSTIDYSTALYFKTVDQPLAQDILDATATKLNTTNDGISQFEDGVLSKSTMPAALSEAFFITNSSEYRSIVASSSSRLTDEAQGIVNGIIAYFTAPAPTITESTNPQLVQSGE